MPFSGCAAENTNQQYLINSIILVGLLAASFLVIIFSIYVVVALSVEEQLPYSDGSMMESLGWKGKLALNLVFIGMAYLGMSLRINSDYYKY